MHLLYINLSWYLWKQGELRFHFSSWQVFNCCALSKSSALQKLVAGESADSLENLEVFPNLPQFWFCFQFPFCCSNSGFPYAHFFVVYMRNHSEKHSFHDLKKKFLEKVNKLIYGLALINLIPTFFSELRFKCRGWLTWGKISLKKHFEFVPLKFSKYMDIYFCFQKIWYSRTYTQSKVLRKVYQFSSVYVHNNTCLILSRKGHSRAPCWYQVSLMIYNTAVCYWFDKFFHQTSSNFNKVSEKIMDVANHIGKNWVLLSNIFLLLLMQRSQQWT